MSVFLLHNGEHLYIFNSDERLVEKMIKSLGKQEDLVLGRGRKVCLDKKERCFLL